VVRLGIEAPQAIPVFREEVLIAMDLEHSHRRSPGASARPRIVHNTSLSRLRSEGN
jgi:sRNA-binding carbon storage regulator CsrA